MTEDSSGNFLSIDEPSGTDHAFGTQNGFFAVDTGAGTILSEPKEGSKDFDPATEGAYKALFYQRVNAQMGQNNLGNETASEDNGTVTIGRMDRRSSPTARAPRSHPVRLGNRGYTVHLRRHFGHAVRSAVLTFRTSGTSQQDVFVTFQGDAVIFSSFKTGLPLGQNGLYAYFYGVGLR